MFLKVLVFFLIFVLTRQILRNLLQAPKKSKPKKNRHTSQQEQFVPEKDIIEGDYRDVSGS